MRRSIETPPRRSHATATSPRGADERVPLKVFLIARLLPHQYDRIGCRPGAFTEDRLRAELPQAARAATSCRLSQLRDCRTRANQRASTGVLLQRQPVFSA